MNFWETFRKATVDPLKWWRYQRFASINKKASYYLEIPEFTVPTPVWIGSSYIVTEFRLSGLTNRFSLRPQGLIPPAGVNFCLAIRTPINNSTGLGVIRYKLWENVGERLYYPMYAGESLSPNSVFEIWSSADYENASLNIPYTIWLSTLLEPSSYMQCCQRGNNQLNVLSQYCALFNAGDGAGTYQIPIEFNQCFNDIYNPSVETFYRVIETGDIRSNESDDLRVWR